MLEVADLVVSVDDWTPFMRVKWELSSSRAVIREEDSRDSTSRRIA
jgi:hypothetical protein